jgi:SPP1 gp7 family putative phage head morphogenesis protein
MPPFPIPDEITPAWFKAMVLQLTPEDGDESDAEQKVREQLEKKFTRELDKAFGEQLDTLIPSGASDDAIRNAPYQVNATSEPVREVLRRNLESGSELGVSVAFDTLEQIGMAFDWTLAHEEAARFASTYSYELIRGINNTTQARMQTAVNDWFRERTTLPDLIKELEPTFGRRRAKNIAITESTRSATEGSRIGYEKSGVVSEVMIRNANDEKVCPICGPKGGTRTPLRGGDHPPYHVNCRCWISPIVETP